MPFYIRARQQDIPTPTISSVASDDEDNYVTDPQQVIDELPLPFRLINKILDEIVEISWTKASALELKRELEAKRIRPPIYSPSETLDYDNVACLCTTESSLMFLGVENSVIAFDLTNKQEISSWVPEDQVGIEHISCSIVSKAGNYLLTIIDDMGFARQIIFANEMFHFVSIFNPLNEGAPKSNALKCEMSQDGEFCAVALECDNACWAEIYKLPIENWNKEIENGRKEFLKKTESMAAATSSLEVSDESETVQVASSEILFPTIKFSPLSLILKVNQPPSLVGTTAGSAKEMLDQVNSGEIIGDGTCHAITGNSIQLQTKLFHMLNENDLQYVKNDLATKPVQPTFHFLRPSCMEPEIQLKTEFQFPFVSIWWSEHPNFMIYQLMKTGKIVEFKPDAVWPHASNITCTALSVCTMILAVGTESGSITLWDRTLGIAKSVVTVCNNIPFSTILFLDSLNKEELSFEEKKSIKVRLLIGSNNGQISVFQSNKDKDLLQTVVPAPQMEEKKFALIRTIPNIPDLFCLVDQTGRLELRSTVCDETHCFLQLPAENQFERPYENGCIMDPNGNSLYIRGSGMLSSTNTLFLFRLRSFPTLDKYRTICEIKEDEGSEPSPKFMDCVQELLTKRMHAQADRTAHLALRWHKLQHQLEFVLNLRETMTIHKKETNYSQSSSSASRWSRTTTKIIAHNKDLKV